MIVHQELPSGLRDRVAGRLTIVDGLRGIAATSVVCYHLEGTLQPAIGAWLHGLVSLVFSYGYLGVPVFFVLSGFVITLNVGRKQVTGNFFWRFALRRSIRLDPPYWASIATAIGLAAIASRLFPDLHKTLPSLPQIASHLFYLQNLLGYGDIVPIYWTLCFEVQFYLFLLFLLAGKQQTQRLITRTHAIKPILLTVALAISALSVTEFLQLTHFVHPGLFVRYWFCFSLGMFCVWALAGWISSYWYFAQVALVAVLCLLGGVRAMAVAALLTSLLLYVAGSANRMRTWLGMAWLQYLGRISYSLYLFHGIVGWSSVSLAKRVIGSPLTVPTSLLVFAFGMAVSILTAHIVYVLIERPSIGWSRSISLTRPDGGPRSEVARPGSRAA